MNPHENENIKVKILSYTNNPLDTIYHAARTCYAPNTEKVFEECSDLNKKTFIRNILKSGHLSVTEHVQFTFYIENISRSNSHQIVRHRISSFSQKSQRYTDSGHDIDKVIIPKSILHNEIAKKLFDNIINSSYDAYNMLIEMGIPKEDARYIIPNASPTSLTMSMNVRELQHFLKLRTCNRAQDEIREVAFKIIRVLYDEGFMWLFPQELIAPNCAIDKCTESKPCGTPYVDYFRFSNKWMLEMEKKNIFNNNFSCGLR